MCVCTDVCRSTRWHNVFVIFHITQELAHADPPMDVAAAVFPKELWKLRR